MKKIYMRVTQDKYELPLAVADSATELAEICNTTKNVVLSSLSHHHAGWAKVELDDEDDNSYK